MKKITLLFCLLFCLFFSAKAQSGFDLVYEIFESKCNTCHSNGSQQGGLDLEGSGTSLAAKKGVVYNNLVNVSPVNNAAAAADLRLVEPGRADLSFLFQKINNGLDPWIKQEPGTGQQMPMNGSLSDIEKETIRQWILYGADRTGKEFDEKVFEKFYTEGGNQAYPDGPPPAPAPGEGFQIKLGPFYLDESGNPNDELEFFTKYALKMESDVEVHRLDLQMSEYSHHLIIYNFEDSNGAGIPPGLRLNPDHSDIGLVAAVQEPTDLVLPKGTAFKWRKDYVLDLNGHYINYSPQGVYQAEAYVNIYTQEPGTAVQEMYTDLLINYNIPIPNNGEIITHTDIVNPSFGKVFLWGMMGHTHKYGKNYKVYRRANFAQQELIYDAACPRGIPNCSSPFFDYRHIPIRYFEPLEPLDITFASGLVHEAQWVNNGNRSVNFGVTSDDEMMVLVLMFTQDTTGLNVSGIYDQPEALTEFDVFPNPAKDVINLELPQVGDYSVALFDPSGKMVLNQNFENTDLGKIDLREIANGFYLLKIEDSDGKRGVEKVFVQKE